MQVVNINIAKSHLKLFYASLSLQSASFTDKRQQLLPSFNIHIVDGIQ